jgi:tetratricopeptide (TPR) repeat protein
VVSERAPYQRILIPLFLASVFLLALTKMSDVDAWIHLTFGRLIWDVKGMPGTEPFLYTMLDKPFTYSSWLFGLLYYAAYHAFNVHGVILLKAVTITVAFSILLKDSLRPRKNVIVVVAVLSLIAVMARYRFVERPDTFLMVFLSFSIFSLNAYVYDNKKYIYALPLIHMLWANSHSSINLMFVPFFAFIAGGVVQRYFGEKIRKFPATASSAQLRTILLIGAASFAASLISPYFTDQYAFGARFLASDWFKQEINELQAPTWESFKWPYLFTGFVAISFVLNRKRFTLIHLLLVVPFIALSFTALRFVFLLGIVGGPVAARNFAEFIHDSQLPALLAGVRTKEYAKTAVAVLLASWIVLSTALILTKTKPFDNDEKDFGFGVSYVNVPEEALRYMDKRNISGRIFNLFQWGQYITWRDFPKRSAFIDGRGFLSEDLIKKMEVALQSPSILEELYRTYGFEALLVSYPFMKTDVPGAFSEEDAVVSSPDWALVYWDDKALVYVKRNGRYASVIRQDEYRFIKPANTAYTEGVFSDAGYRAHLIEELKRNIAETGSSKAYALLGLLYNKVGLHREAVEAFSRVRLTFPEDHRALAYSGMGYAYLKLDQLDTALAYYKKSLALAENDALYYEIGTVYLKKGEKRKALSFFEKGLRLHKNIRSVYPLLIGLYRDLDMGDKEAELQKIYQQQSLVDAGKEHFEKGVKAYFSKRYETAADEFKESIAANPSNPASYSNLGYIYYDMGEMSLALQYHKKTVEIDPGYANSHYGLALIYMKRGESRQARQHLREYLRLEPAGYYSRKAKELLKGME